MGGDLHVLRDAIRKPMLDWWLRCGIWWVCAAIGLIIFNAIMTHSMIGGLGGPGYVMPDWLWTVCSAAGLAGDILISVVWLLAAVHCRNLISGFFEKHRDHDQAMHAPYAYRLVYFQGLYPVLLVWLVMFGNEMASRGLGGSFYAGRNIWLAGVDVFSSSVYSVLPLAISMIWLAGLLVILPRLTWPAWVLFCATPMYLIMGEVIGFLINNDMYFIPAIPPGISEWYTVMADGGKLLGVAVITGMFYCFRAGRHKPAWILYAGLVFSIYNLLQYPLLMNSYLSDAYYRLCYVPGIIGAAYDGWVTFGVYEWVSNLQQPVLPQGTVLVHLIPLVPVMVSLLWPVAMFALMYYVILRTRLKPAIVS